MEWPRTIRTANHAVAWLAVLFLFGLPGAGCTSRPDPTPPGPASSNSAAPSAVPADWPRVLDALARAADDPVRWAELTRTDDPRFAAESSTLQRNLAQFDLGLEQAGEATAAEPELAAAAGADRAWTVPVRVRWAVPGESAKVANTGAANPAAVNTGAVNTGAVNTVWWTFRQHDGRWELAGTGTPTSATRNGNVRRPIWALGPIAVTSSDRASVISAGTGTTAEATATLTALDLAAAALDRQHVGHRDAPDRPLTLDGAAPMLVAELPASTEDAAVVLGTDSMRAAATTGAAGERGAAMRIVVDPANRLTEQARRVLLTHEAVHAATRSTEFAAAPLWLTEGYADRVAFGAEPAAAEATRERLAPELTDPATRRGLPASAEFSGSGSELDLVYARAWLGVLALGDHVGTVYAEVGGGADPASALARVGIDEAGLDRDVVRQLNEIGG